MREPTIARNYAQALLEAGREAGDLELHGELLAAVAGALEAEPNLRLALELPRIRKEVKLDLIARALGDVTPRTFVRFLQAVITRGRQSLLPAMSEQYQQLVDREFNRIHAGLTLAREPDDGLVRLIAERLSVLLKQDVVPHVRTRPALLGGIVIRVGERVYDGSLRRRLRALRRAMLSA